MVVGVSVYLADTGSYDLVDIERWRILTQQAISSQGVLGEAECYLTFVGEDEIAEMNAKYMGKVGATDVLSFPISWEAEFSGEIPRILGEVFVCPQIAAQNAPKNCGGSHRGTLDDEIALLLVHGVLHLAGMDHVLEEEAEDMEALEQELLSRYYYTGQSL